MASQVRPVVVSTAKMESWYEAEARIMVSLNAASPLKPVGAVGRAMSLMSGVSELAVKSTRQMCVAFLGGSEMLSLVVLAPVT